MDDGLAEKSLKRGFGWSSQAYWWKDKVNEVPKPGEVGKSVHKLLGIPSHVGRYPCLFALAFLKEGSNSFW